MKMQTLESRTGFASFGKGLWGWFVGLGVALAGLGLIASANLFVATVAAIYTLGALMLAGGIFQIGHAIAVLQWCQRAPNFPQMWAAKIPYAGGWGWLTASGLVSIAASALIAIG